MKRGRGQAFILVLILLGVGAVMITPLLHLASTALKSRQMYGQYINEDYAADAAIEYGIWRLQYEPGFAATLPPGVESEPFYITLNGVEASTTIIAQAPSGQLSGQDLAGRASDEPFKVTKAVIATTTYATLAADGFESGSGNGGTGPWIGNWALSGDYAFSDYGSYEGSYHLRLRGDDWGYPGDGYAQREVNLSGSTGEGPFLNFWARVESFESGDWAKVKVSTNGIDWDVLETYDYQDSDNQWHLSPPYDLSGYGTPSSFYLAFETNLSSSYDYFHIDSISFCNTEEATIIEPGVVTEYTYYVTIQCLDPEGCCDQGWGQPNLGLDKIIDILPGRGASSGDYLQYIPGSTYWDAGVYNTFASDGFESGGGTGGTGSWIGNWSFSGDCSVIYDYWLAYEGIYHLRLRGGSGYAQRAVDLSGSTEAGPFLYFWARMDNLESSDTIDVKVSTNGVDWDVLETFDEGDADNIYHLHPYDLTSYGRPSTLYVAFEANMDSTYDYFYVDDVEFSNFPGTTTDEWPMPPFDPTNIGTAGSGSDLHQELTWDFEDAGYGDVCFSYGEIKTMSFKARAALTEGVYCNKVQAAVSTYWGWGWEDDIVAGSTAKITVGDPEVTECIGGLLTVEKTADPLIIYPNELTTITYTITMQNVDTVPIRIYQLEDWLPSTGSDVPEESFVYVDSSAYGYIIGRSSLPVLFYDNFSRPDSYTVSYWTDSDGNGSDVALYDNYVRLTTPSETYYGNQFLATATSGIGNMTSYSYKTSLRFTAQSNQTVTKIRVYLQTEAGNSPSYRYGIQGNSGSQPSGTWLGTGQQGYGDFTATTTGWQTITLNQPVALTEGTVYCIVVQPQGTPSTSNYIALRRSTPKNNMLPYDGASDPNSNTLWYSGYYWWTTQDYQPIYMLETATPTYEGDPCETSAEQSVYGVNYGGEKLTVSGDEHLVTDIGFYVRCNNAITKPADDLYYEIRDGTDAVIRSGVLVTNAQITSNYSWRDAQLSSPLELVDGATYRVNIYSTSSTSSYYYQVLRTDNTDDAAYNGRNYDGTGSVYCSSADSGSSWADSNQYDIPFRLTTTPRASITQYNISTIGNFGNVLSYQWRGYDTESTDTLKVEWKTSSSSDWNTLAEHPLSYTSSWQNASYDLPAEADDTSIDIRFTGITDYWNEYARVDNVKVTCSSPVDITPVCMPDDNEGWDEFFYETWHWDSRRWELDWDFNYYPDENDPVWGVDGLCSGYPYADYDPYLELQPGEIFEVVFQASVTLVASGSYYDEVFVRINDEWGWWEDDWVYSWPTGGVTVPQYDLQAETLNSILRAAAMLSPDGFWWRSWHWWWR